MLISAAEGLLRDNKLRRTGPSPTWAATEPFAPQPRNALMTWFYGGLLALGLFTFLSLFQWATGAALKGVGALHYSFWLMTVAGVGLHLNRAGWQHMVRTLAPLLPFLLIGVVSGLLGINPIASARSLTFWILGMLAAAAIGGELPSSKLRSFLFWMFAAVLLISALLALFAPHYGLSGDDRAFAGRAWRGAFIQKNHLGAGCALAAAVTLFAKEVWWPFRVSMAVLIAACILFSGSQGGGVTTLSLIGFAVAVTGLRRSGFSPGLQAIILGLGSVLGLLAIAFGAPLLLSLLNRDATLSGRSEIWAAFLQRASYFWLKGAGPASFSESSAATIDLTRSFASLGTIDTPHNRYIAVFGEVGIFGLLIYLAMMGYFAFVLPLFRRDINALATATIAIVALVGGMIETRQVYGINSDMLFMVLMFAALNRDQAGLINADLENTAEAQSSNQPPISDLYSGPRGPIVLA